MDLSLKGKYFMIAAASRGLGYGIAKVLVEEGATVCIGARHEEEIMAAAKRLNDSGPGTAIPAVLDANNDESIAAWFELTQSKFPTLDGLLVNAGGPPAGSFDDFSDEHWKSAFKLTLLSAVRMIRLALPRMREQQSGSILTITSSSFKEPIDNLILSNVMRSGVVSLVKSLSKQLAADGIRINNIVPGIIDTDRVKNLDKITAESMGISIQDRRKQNTAFIPMGRYGNPDEFGRMGAFLLSDAASYINGASIMVDGGKSTTVW